MNFFITLLLLIATVSCVPKISFDYTAAIRTSDGTHTTGYFTSYQDNTNSRNLLVSDNGVALNTGLAVCNGLNSTEITFNPITRKCASQPKCWEGKLCSGQPCECKLLNFFGGLAHASLQGSCSDKQGSKWVFKDTAKDITFSYCIDNIDQTIPIALSVNSTKGFFSYHFENFFPFTPPAQFFDVPGYCGCSQNQVVAEKEDSFTKKLFEHFY